jgi:hypothetical protein
MSISRQATRSSGSGTCSERANSEVASSIRHWTVLAASGKSFSSAIMVHLLVLEDDPVRSRIRLPRRSGKRITSQVMEGAQRAC